MAWTAPMTAIPNTVFTAAQFNTHVRDNLNETAPAKATTPGGYFITSGVNSIVERVVGSDVIIPEEMTMSTSYTDLTTIGPTVTVNTSIAALVFFGCQIGNTSLTASSRMSFAVSGASSVAAADAMSYGQIGRANVADRSIAGVSRYVTGLTPGSNTFTAKYRVSSDTGSFSVRHLVVMPL